jgi:hypothetical protein
MFGIVSRLKPYVTVIIERIESEMYWYWDADRPVQKLIKGTGKE